MNRQWRFSVEQRRVLVEIFMNGIHNPSFEEWENIANDFSKLGGEVDFRSVNNWFKNRRARMNREARLNPSRD
jgi:hypothetical protein